MTSICLNMIVKNESHVIRRCLDSVLPLMTTWCLLDTGSTDGTQALIREHLKAIPGELHQSDWKGFARSRTEAIRLARGRADYLLFIDADDEMVLPEGFQLPDLSLDAYDLFHRQGETRFLRRDLVATRLEWKYQGILHEYIECEGPFQAAVLEGPWILERREGARSLDPRKYEKDAELLEQALRDEPGNARYQFYLGQSYRDAGLLDKAVEAYSRRAAMGGWDEEVYVSRLRIAQLLETLQRPEAEVVHAYLEAFQARPQRAESLCNLARFLRGQGKYALALMFAQVGLSIPIPADTLFLDETCYTWRCLDEFAIASYWVGRRQDSMKACDRLLSEGHLPAGEYERVRKNRAFAATPYS
jgi:glycosyltransferase involved in cell wall biosynthesis